MVLRNSFTIMTSRFSLVYKVILYTLIISIVFGALIFAVMNPIFKPIISDINELKILETVSDTLKSLFESDENIFRENLQILKADFYAFLDIFSTRTNLVIAGGITLAVLILLAKMFSDLALIPIADVTNHFMNSNSKYGFTSNFTANIKRSFGFAGLSALISLTIYAVIGGICVGMALLLYKLSYILAIQVCLLLLFAGLALKKAVFAFWVPTIINSGEGVIKSLKISFASSRKNLKYTFGLFFITYFFMYAIGLILAIVTFSLGLILTVGISTVLSQIIELVFYYRCNNKKYYIEPNTVVDPSTRIIDNQF